MKKFTFLAIAILITCLGFAQSHAIKLNNPIPASAEKSDWVGNTGLSALDIVDPGYEYAVRFTAGQLTSGDDITKVKFYSDATTYAGYGITNTAYTIKIYEGGSFDVENGYDVITACGTAVYTQAYTASADGWQEVTLTTPYTIGSGEFWVSIQCTNTGAVFMGDADAASANTYVRSASNEGTDYWLNNEFCVDTECTSTEFNPWSLAVYVDDGGTYVENSDMYSAFLESGSAPYTSISEIEISGTEDLVLYPIVGNDGPDATSNNVNIAVTVDGTGIIDQDIDMSGDNALASGYFTFLAADPYSVTVTAEEMNTLGATGTFDVCLTVTYDGVDNNSANNEACITVTRGTVNVSENIVEAISVYPNPANNVINISNAAGETIVVLNMVGEVVATIDNASANQTIDISNLAEGTYFVKVNAETFKVNVVK